MEPIEALKWLPLYPDDPSDHRATATLSGVVLRVRYYVGTRDGDKVAFAVVDEHGTVTMHFHSLDRTPLLQQHDRVTIEYLKCNDGSLSLVELAIDWTPTIQAARQTQPPSAEDS